MNNVFIEKDIEDTLSTAFLEYAGYNLQRRAIPDSRDGLKWSARQLIHAQSLAKLTYDKPFKKASKSVAQAMSFSYVHGDSSAYGTLIRMAKPFAMNVPLQEANGNYGTLINPDDHSAPRYVELRGSEASSYLLQDLEKNTIDEWEDTYDLEGQFPKVLPAKGFWGLVNGCISIGSGMSSSIPPTNIKEVNQKMIDLLWNPNIDEDKLIVMPDFPTGAIILNENEIRESLKKGVGKACKIRAVIEYNADENCLVVKEMPYSTYTNTICTELANYIQDHEETGIKDFVDYTGENPDLRIYLKKGANYSKVLKELYANTSLQTFYSINMVMLENGITPRVFGWKEALQAHINHEKIVYTKSFQYDLDKINRKLHIIEGLLKAIDCIDEVIQTIKSSSSTTEANRALCNLLKVDSEQADAILNIKLSKLANLEVSKLVNEQAVLTIDKNRIEKILNDKNLLNKEIEKGLRETAKKFGKERKTKILNISSADDEPEKEIRMPEENCVVIMTESGLIKRIPSSSFKTQRRNGAGVKTQDGITSAIIRTNTIDSLMVFTDKGKMYRILVDDIPVGTNSSKGVPIKSLIDMESFENPTLIYSIYYDTDAKYILFVTKNGTIKKTLLSEYIGTKKKSGVVAISLREGDSLASVSLIKDEPLMIISKNGMAIKFKSTDVSASGRATMGMRGMNIAEDDEVITALPIRDPQDTLAVFTSNGLGKRVNLNEFVTQSRGGKGAACYKPTKSTGYLVSGCLCGDSDTLLITGSNKGICISALEINTLGRTSSGVQIIKEGKITGVSKV